jgi:hypothetical protein
MVPCSDKSSRGDFFRRTAATILFEQLSCQMDLPDISPASFFLRPARSALRHTAYYGGKGIVNAI